MTIVCHLWPGITPWNVWDLPWHLWVRFARDADAHIAARQQQQTEVEQMRGLGRG